MNIRSEKEDNKMDIEIDNSDNLSNLLKLKLKENENKEIVKESIKQVKEEKKMEIISIDKVNIKMKIEKS